MAGQSVVGALQKDQQALAAGVHHAGLFQHRQLAGGIGQRFFRHFQTMGQHGFKIRSVLGRFLAGGGKEAEHGEDGALHRLHHGFIREVHAPLQGGGKGGGVGPVRVLQSQGDAAEHLGKDDAGIAPGPHEGAHGEFSGQTSQGQAVGGG